MNNFRRPGSPVKRTAPSGGVTSGVPLMIGGLLLVPIESALVGVEFEAEVEGVFLLPKTSAQAWTEDQKVYFNVSTSKIDSDATTGPLVGVADAVAANPSGYGRVRLNGSAASTSEGPQTTLAALTDSSGGATADGTIGLVTAPTALTGAGGGTANGALEDESTFTPSVAWNGSSVYPSAADATSIQARIASLKNNVAELAARQAENRTAIVALTDAIKELSTRDNDVLSRLKAAGIIASS